MPAPSNKRRAKTEVDLHITASKIWGTGEFLAKATVMSSGPSKDLGDPCHEIRSLRKKEMPFYDIALRLLLGDNNNALGLTGPLVLCK